jgi:hypothetical protein
MSTYETIRDAIRAVADSAGGILQICLGTPGSIVQYPPFPDQDGTQWDSGKSWGDEKPLQVELQAVAAAIDGKPQTCHFFIESVSNVEFGAGVELGGVWEAPFDGAVTRVMAHRKSTTGVGGGTHIDVNVRGTTIFTTQSNRPYIPYDDADGKAVSTTIEAGSFSTGDLVTMDVDDIDGVLTDLTVVITVQQA